MNPEEKKKPEKTEAKPPIKLQVLEGTNLKEFADRAKIRSKDLMDKLSNLGYSVSLSSNIDQVLAEAISQILKAKIELISLEKAAKLTAEINKDEMIPKVPVVTIMGHVDHGKTTLLDSIRESNLVNKEAGGITQHIGAYQVIYNDRTITFIDTPGHEAFTQLRARGAQSTDIVILIVAANDGVMPQTLEAINHAKAANVPIIVAVNKIDLGGADPDKVKQQLSKEGLLVEDWGGDIVSINISAKEKTNLDELLEMILLLTDVNEFKGNPNVAAHGVILEARLDSRTGPVATVIIQHGVLYKGDAFITGYCYGKAKNLFDENGKSIEQAEISMPVEVLGFSDVPASGDLFQVVADLDIAKKIIQQRVEQQTDQKSSKQETLTLDQLFKNIEEGETKELPLIIKTDVQGSLDVLQDVLPNLSTDKVKIKFIHAATGNISESDLILAAASNAIVIGYNTKTSQAIFDLAKKKQVEIRNYSIIYQLSEDLKKAMTGMLDPIEKETYLGRADVRKIFRIPRIGIIAGCLVTDGKITRNAEIRILRDNEIIHQGKISSLKHLKNNVTEVKRDYECGIGIDNFKDITEGDVIEAFTIEKIMPE